MIKSNKFCLNAIILFLLTFIFKGNGSVYVLQSSSGPLISISTLNNIVQYYPTTLQGISGTQNQFTLPFTGQIAFQAEAYLNNEILMIFSPTEYFQNVIFSPTLGTFSQNPLNFSSVSYSGLQPALSVFNDGSYVVSYITSTGVCIDYFPAIGSSPISNATIPFQNAENQTTIQSLTVDQETVVILYSNQQEWSLAYYSKGSGLSSPQLICNQSTIAPLYAAHPQMTINNNQNMTQLPTISYSGPTVLLTVFEPALRATMLQIYDNIGNLLTRFNTPCKRAAYPALYDENSFILNCGFLVLLMFDGTVLYWNNAQTITVSKLIYVQSEMIINSNGTEGICGPIIFNQSICQFQIPSQNVCPTSCKGETPICYIYSYFTTKEVTLYSCIPDLTSCSPGYYYTYPKSGWTYSCQQYLSMFYSSSSIAQKYNRVQICNLRGPYIVLTLDSGTSQFIYNLYYQNGTSTPHQYFSVQNQYSISGAKIPFVSLCVPGKNAVQILFTLTNVSPFLWEVSLDTGKLNFEVYFSNLPVQATVYQMESTFTIYEDGTTWISYFPSNANGLNTIQYQSKTNTITANVISTICCSGQLEYVQFNQTWSALGQYNNKTGNLEIYIFEEYAGLKGQFQAFTAYTNFQTEFQMSNFFDQMILTSYIDNKENIEVLGYDMNGNTLLHIQQGNIYSNTTYANPQVFPFNSSSFLALWEDCARKSVARVFSPTGLAMTTEIYLGGQNLWQYPQYVSPGIVLFLNYDRFIFKCNGESTSAFSQCQDFTNESFCSTCEPNSQTPVCTTLFANQCECNCQSADASAGYTCVHGQLQFACGSPCQPETPTCNLVTQYCNCNSTSCALNTPTTPICSQNLERCECNLTSCGNSFSDHKECLSGGSCGTSTCSSCSITQPYCSGSTCVCAFDSDCQASGADAICVNEACTCRSCSGETPTCDTSSLTCVCSANSCPSGLVCGDSGSCTCPTCTGTTPVCNITLPGCVCNSISCNSGDYCATNNTCQGIICSPECSGTSPFCNTTFGDITGIGKCVCTSTSCINGEECSPDLVCAPPTCNQDSDCNYQLAKCTGGICTIGIMDYDCRFYSGTPCLMANGSCGVCPPNVLSLAIIGEPLLQVKHYEQVPVVATLGISPTVFNYSKLTVEWTTIGGNISFNSSWINPNSSLVLLIPACTFPNFGTYALKISCTYEGIGSSYAEIAFTVNDTEYFSVTFAPTINPDGSLTLSSQMEYDGKCPGDIPTYSWGCSNISGNNYCPYVTGQTGDTISSIPKVQIEGTSADINITATISTNSATGTKQLDIAANDITASLKCIKNCVKYSPNLSSDFKIIGDLDKIGAYSFTMTPSVPFITGAVGDCSTTVTTKSFSSYSTLTVTLVTSVSATFTLPINTPPSGGPITISPTSGDPLTTVFTFGAANFVDEDLPMQFQFFYKLNETDSYTALTEISLINNIETPLPGKPTPCNSALARVDVYDSFMYSSTSTATFQITAIPTDPTQLASSITSVISSQSPSYAKANIAAISSAITSIANLVNSNSVTLTSQQESAINDESIRLINNLESSYILSDNNTQVESTILQAVGTILTQTESVMNSETCKAVTDMISNSFGISNTSTNLEKSVIDALADAFDAILSYTVKKDCDIKLNYTSSLEQIYKHYVAAISQSQLEGLTDSDGISYISRHNFAIGSVVVVPCMLTGAGQSYSVGNNAPVINISLPGSSTDCSTKVTLQIFTLKDPLFFQCNGRRLQSTLQVTPAITPNGLSSTQTETLATTFSAGNCPSGCTNSGTSCSCTGTGSLNYVDVIHSLFIPPTSSSPSLTAGEGQLNTKNNSLFWAIIVMCFWLIVHYDRKYCKSAMDQYKALKLKTKSRALLTEFEISNPIISAYKGTDSKQTRLLFFTRWIMMIAYVAIFTYLTFDGTTDYQFNISICFIGFGTYVPLAFITNLVSRDRKRSLLILVVLPLISMAITMTLTQISQDQISTWLIKNLLIVLAVEIFCYGAVGFLILFGIRIHYMHSAINRRHPPFIYTFLLSQEVIEIYHLLIYSSKKQETNEYTKQEAEPVASQDKHVLGLETKEINDIFSPKSPCSSISFKFDFETEQIENREEDLIKSNNSPRLIHEDQRVENQKKEIPFPEIQGTLVV